MQPQSRRRSLASTKPERKRLLKGPVASFESRAAMGHDCPLGATSGRTASTSRPNTERSSRQTCTEGRGRSTRALTAAPRLPPKAYRDYKQDVDTLIAAIVTLTPVIAVLAVLLRRMRRDTRRLRDREAHWGGPARRSGPSPGTSDVREPR